MNEKKTASTAHKAMSRSEVTTQVAVYSASVLAGLVSMWSAIRHHFNTNMKSKMDWFDTISTDPVIARKIEDLKSLSSTAHYIEHKKIHDIQASATRDIIREKGYTNSWRKFRFLTLHQRVQVIGIAITVATVAVGTIMNIRQGWQNEHMMRQLDELNRKKDGADSANVNIPQGSQNEHMIHQLQELERKKVGTDTSLSIG
jgi:hypothetical protein